ncbi:hypothetical protein OG871_36450 [Kitasatospora sp. NBC_00374]|uniref:hypothetical protein n=1 Tax=Kitasatospora sp. NBC_00374 TaxID=2975964 RepID=UPI00324C78F9
MPIPSPDCATGRPTSPRADIARLPVKRLEPRAYSLAWLTESENDMIRAFARVVCDLGPLLD